MSCELTGEPDAKCNNLDHWRAWVEIVTLEVGRDNPEASEDDIFHDCAQNVMWQMPIKIIDEFARRTGVQSVIGKP